MEATTELVKEANARKAKPFGAPEHGSERKESASARTKEKGKEKSKEKKLLISAEDYKAASVIVGTKVITGYMEQYVYKRRADGLAIIDVEKTDQKIQAAANFLAQFEPKDILAFCKREAGWQPLEKFGEVTGARVFIRRYPAGTITNPTLPTFFEPKVLITVDPWIDKNAIFDAQRIGIPVLSICDTNNVTNNLDLVIPANNKTKSSIAIIFYLIAKGYTKVRGLPFKAKIEDFDPDFESEIAAATSPSASAPAPVQEASAEEKEEGTEKKE